MESEVRNTMPDLPSTSEIARLARSPSALLNHLSNMSDTPSANGDAESSTNGDGTVDPSAGGARTATPATTAAGRRRRHGQLVLRPRYGRR